MKVVTILGARPQFIKSAPVSTALQNHGIGEVVIHTGQHFDPNMSDIFFDEMKILPPAHNLGIHGGTHAQMTGRMLIEVERVLEAEKPDAVLVYGDTNSTLAGALVSAKLNLPLVHVESGLRSFNMKMPEEINRIITDRLSSVLFCPTNTAVENLEKEGIFSSEDKSVVMSGDVMYDALLHFLPVSKQRSVLLKSMGLSSGEFILLTLHRQENTDTPQRLDSILKAITRLSKTYRVVFPVHPRTRALLSSADFKNTGVIPIDPVGYLDMLALLEGCQLVITDSGGLQKEAFMMKKFCVTCREETEWVELVESGVNRLCGAVTDQIYEAANHFLGLDFPSLPSFYGNGNASDQIALTLQKKFGKT